MRLRRCAAAVAIVAATAGCVVPAEPEPFPGQDEQVDEYLDELNREAERQMEEMMRENQELIDQFSPGLDDDSLPLTGIGG